ncbi:hypothetical protein HID58_051578 [Brassica napus]|uniref:Uncharacterized protein n=1 Tax=Brassica napus TaxID=3708 RepID=A0ABQ8A9K2_BRANA|nr:hypothetical protein HID58_051578 [Brassica napus]
MISSCVCFKIPDMWNVDPIILAWPITPVTQVGLETLMSEWKSDRRSNAKGKKKLMVSGV